MNYDFSIIKYFVYLCNTVTIFVYLYNCVYDFFYLLRVSSNYL